MTRRVLERVYDLALDGLPVLGTPWAAARRARRDVAPGEEPAERLERRYKALGGIAGFAFGLPGYASAPVTIPSNVAAVAALQLHLAAATAVLAGRNPRDEGVRTRCLACVGDAPVGKGAAAGGEGVASRLVEKIGERGVRFLGEQAAGWIGRGAGRGTRSLPVLGGLVGALADSRSTRRVARRARTAFFGDEGG